MAATGAFAEFLAALRSVRLVATAGSASLSPVILAFAGIAPPWPAAIVKLTTMLALFLSMLNFYSLLDNKNASPKRRAMLSAVLCCVLLPVYLVALDLFTFKIPTTGETEIVGCGYTADALLVARANHFDDGFGCPGSYERMLEAAQYNPYEIWGKLSLGIVPVVIVMLWLIVVTSISIGMTSLAVSQRSRPAARARRRSGGSTQSE
jgi:hypothetical protein